MPIKYIMGRLHLAGLVPHYEEAVIDNGDEIMSFIQIYVYE